MQKHLAPSMSSDEISRYLEERNPDFEKSIQEETILEYKSSTKKTYERDDQQGDDRDDEGLMIFGKL